MPEFYVGGVMEEFAPLLKALRKLKPQGGDGFEGLIRDCLEAASGRHLRLQKSGPQDGHDIRSEPELGLPMLTIEAKRFGLKTALPLDELKSKLLETARSDAGTDIWGLVLSREMKEPDWSQLQKIGAEHGIHLLCIDWREGTGTLPVLAALCAAGRHVAGPRLGGAAAADLEAAALHPDYGRVVARLRQQLNAPEAGFNTAAAAAAAWLRTAAGSQAKARERLRSHADLLSADAHWVQRPAIGNAMSDWWKAGAETPLVVVGDEGRGKTWAALSWCIEKAAETEGPLVLAASSKDIRSANGEEVLVDLLQRCMPAVNRTALQARASRWLQHADSAKVLVLVDGLNEKWSVPWHELVRSFDAPPLAGKVALVLTCRSAFWRDDLGQLQGATRAPAREVTVTDFSDPELDAYLATHRLARNDMSQGLLQLIRIPRFARLALALRDRLGDEEDLTVARLVLEDWRARLALRGGELRVDDESLLGFAAGLGREVLSDPDFKISETEILQRLAVHSGRGLDHYREAINELVEGLWLTRDGAHQYRVNAALLPFAIGLDLAQSVERLADRRAVDDVVAQYEEQLRGADIGVAILRAAASISMARGKATRVAMEVLLEKWIGSQNFAAADFEEMWPLASRQPAVFIDVAERTFAQWGPTRGEGEVLAKGLANAAKWPAVRGVLAERTATWAGSYGRDPVRWRYGERFPAHADRERDVLESEADWSRAEPAFHRRISAHFRVDASRHLAGSALAVISYVERTPFTETIVTLAVTRALMGGDADHGQLEWVLRLNNEDVAATRDALSAEIAALRKLDSTVAGRAAGILALALSDPRDPSPNPPQDTAEMAARRHGPRPGLDAGALIVWSATPSVADVPDLEWIASLAPFAANPKARLERADAERLMRVASRIADGSQSDEDIRWDRDAITLVLSRWAPHALCTWLRAALIAPPGIDRRMRAHPADRLEETVFLLGDGEKRSLTAQGFDGLAASTPDTADKERSLERRLKSMVVAGIIGTSAAEQIEALARLLPSFLFSRPLARMLSPPAPPDLNAVFGRLSAAADAADEDAISGWLGYLREVGLSSEPAGAAILLQLARHPNKGIRGQAMSVLLISRDEVLCRAFVDGGWFHERVRSRRRRLLGRTSSATTASISSSGKPVAAWRPKLSRFSYNSAAAGKRSCAPRQTTFTNCWMSASPDGRNRAMPTCIGSTTARSGGKSSPWTTVRSCGSCARSLRGAAFWACSEYFHRRRSWKRGCRPGPNRPRRCGILYGSRAAATATKTATSSGSRLRSRSTKHFRGCGATRSSRPLRTKNFTTRLTVRCAPGMKSGCLISCGNISAARRRVRLLGELQLPDSSTARRRRTNSGPESLIPRPCRNG